MYRFLYVLSYGILFLVYRLSKKEKQRGEVRVRKLCLGSVSVSELATLQIKCNTT
jgi:hypothetical protein